MKNPQVLIRKYGDRRLYDTGASRYVKLEDIARMVRDGIDVRVVDDRTGKDITHVVFTQIIVENAREKEIALPLQLLTQLVRTSDKATHEFLTWYLNNTLDLYKKAQDTVHSRLSDAKRAVSSPMDFVRDLLSQYSGPIPEPPTEETEKSPRRSAKPGSGRKRSGKPKRRSMNRKATTE
jgi:polyhydroxyalkanoate synthesis repressor PhaR